MIKAIIFDFGGVIVNETDPQLIQGIAEAFDIGYDSALVAIKKLVPDYQKGKITDKEFWQKFGKQIGKNSSFGNRDLWLKIYAKESKMQPKMIELVKNLKKKGYIIALLSNTIPPHKEFNIQKGRFAPFDPIILSCDIGIRKPDLGIFEYALEKLRLKPEECIYIDDKQIYVDAAEKVGIRGIKFESYSQLIKEFKKLGIKAL